MLWTESIIHAGAHNVVFFVKIVSGAVVTGIVQKNEQNQTACYVLRMGLSECLPLKAFSEKFICHVLQLPGHQWFFKCIHCFLPRSQPARCCWCGSTRNVTYVRRENAHPAHVQHVLQGRHKPKEIARAKICLLLLITGRVKNRSSQESFWAEGNRSSGQCRAVWWEKVCIKQHNEAEMEGNGVFCLAWEQ